MEIKDGKTGSPEAKPHGSPGRKKEIREIKKALPGTRMGSAGRTGRRNKRFGDEKWASREPKARPGGPNV